MYFRIDSLVFESLVLQNLNIEEGTKLTENILEIKPFFEIK